MPSRRFLLTLSRLTQNTTREASDLAVLKRATAQAAIHKKEHEVSPSSSYQPFYDTFGRVHNYLRISLTEKCNLRCTYCMPAEGVTLTPKPELLTVDEIIHLVDVFAQNGIDKVRVTGGEPTVRGDLLDIIRRIKSVPGIKSLGMTTNGITLHRIAAALRDAGLDKINISLDTLKDDMFLQMTRRKGLKHVLKSIDAAEEVFPMVKINNVVMRSTNYVEMLSFIEWTKNRRLDVRFIEYMPFGGNDFNTDQFVGYKEMMDRVKSYFGEGNVIRLQDDPHDTTKAYKIRGYDGQFGFITSMSEHFCATCNRLRITADGNLKVCLHGNKEVSMRDLLRSGASDEEITDVVRAAVQRKKKQHADFRNGEFETLTKQANDSHWRVSRTPFLHLLLSNSFLTATSVRLYHSDSKFPLLTHVNPDGTAKQVDVTNKPQTERKAIAQGFIRLTPAITQQIKLNQTKKGDVMGVARLAGIMGAKQTANLIPLCHNIPLNVVSIDVSLMERSNEIMIVCMAKTKGSTGVEMEALTGVAIAALTVYDMCKAVSTEMEIFGIRLVSKTGGKSDYFYKGDTPCL